MAVIRSRIAIRSTTEARTARRVACVELEEVSGAEPPTRTPSDSEAFNSAERLLQTELLQSGDMQFTTMLAVENGEPLHTETRRPPPAVSQSS